jgi:glycosyltransferase involved in cell wall biosynthesis
MRENLDTLSIVLPVYNVAKWLEKCLDSIFQQTWPADEIIAVDDGSTDNSYKILSRYAKIHPQLKIIRQSNGGLSVARNTGIAAATGTYLIFIDSDDFIDENMYSIMMNMVTSNNLDMAICNGWFYFENREPNKLINHIGNSIVMPGKEWLKERLRSKKIIHMVWMHIYKTRFIKKEKFEFIPGQVHEDVIWTNQILIAAKTMQYIDKPLYYYRIRQNRSGADQIRRSIEYVIPCSVTNTNILIDIANNIKQDSELAQLMRWQAVDSGFAVFHLIEKLSNKKSRIEQLNTLWNSNFFRLMWNNSTSINHKRKVIRLTIKKFLRLI